MLKTIAKIGNSQGLILDAALLDMTGLKVGDQVNIAVHKGGTITLTPMRGSIGPEEGAREARELIRRNAKLFKRLA